MTSISKTATYDPGDGGAPWRLGVGIILINNEGKTLAFRRAVKDFDIPGVGPTYQYPQGGIDKGETPEQARDREAYEEVGLGAGDIEWLHQLPQKTEYLFPDYVAKRHDGKYRGQQHAWFVGLLKVPTSALKFDVVPHEIEFDGFKWCRPEELYEQTIAFRQATYRAVIDMLRPWLDSWLKQR